MNRSRAIQQKTKNGTEQTASRGKWPVASGISGPQADILALQRTAGNRAVSQLAEAAPSGPEMMQTKLPVSQPGDRLEREADDVARKMARAACPENAARVSQVYGGCDEQVQRQTRQRPPQTPATASNRQKEIRSRRGGQSLPPPLRTVMESQLQTDLGQVRLHTDSPSNKLAQAVGAQAFTVGQDIVFGAGEYAPERASGRELLAHELTHIVQQQGGSGSVPYAQESSTTFSGAISSAPAGLVQRSPDDETDDRTADRRAKDFRSVNMHFDGRELIVHGDRTEVFRFSAQSGRPVPLQEEHAEECGADARTDTYMNDRRFVGIRNMGPIPEGTYTFSPPRLQRFGGGEQFRLMAGGIFGVERVRVAGGTVHAGDWGSGRVALRPQGRLREGPCGSANRRSEFFLHGGLLAGSAGCIDIGTDFGRLADFLEGYRRPIQLTVAYEHEPPGVGFFTGLSGGLAYGFQLRHGPSLQLGAEIAPGGTRFVAAAGYNAILQWAGGSLTAGARLDVPMDSREAFVRAGLSSGVNFRLLGTLYGRLQAGYSWDLSGARSGEGLELGGGVRYDLGRVELEALYNVLRPLSEDERIHQVLVGAGFRF